MSRAPGAKVWLVAGCLLAYATLLGLQPVIANDIWLHLTTGRVILEEKATPQTDRYSFTAEGNRYVAHEWLAQTAYALAERWGGLQGARLASKTLPTVAVAALLLLACWASGARPSIAFPIVLMTLTALQNRLLARPELLAWCLLLAMLALLFRDWRRRHEGGATRAVYALIPLQAIWVNVHGSFLIGIAVTLIFAGAELGDRLLGSRDRPAARVRALFVAATLGAALAIGLRGPPDIGPPVAVVLGILALLVAADGAAPLFRDPHLRTPGVVRLLAIAAGMALIGLANPLGVEIYTFPFEFTAQVNLVTRFVMEWRPLLDAPQQTYLSVTYSSYVVFATLWCLALALGAWRGSLGRLEVGLFVAMALLPFRHLRWMATVCLVTTPALASTLSHAAVQARSGSPTRVAAAVALAALGLAVLAVGAAPHYGSHRDFALAGVLLLALALGACALVAALAPGGGLGRGGGVWVAGAAAVTLCILSVAHGIPTRPYRAYGPALREFAPGGWPAQAAPGVTYLRTHQIPGRLFTNYGWASYAVHQLWPAVTVFIDGRSEVYGEGLIGQYRALFADTRGARRVVERYEIDLALLPKPPGNPRPVGIYELVRNQHRWRLLFEDEFTLLYARLDRDRSLPPPASR